MATETTPLNPATEAYASKSAAELQQEKKNLIDGDLNSKLKQGKDVEKGEGGEEEELPNGPLDKCCAPFRENCLFTQCVAREKETPLNILHIFQPTCVVLLAIGLALTSSAAFPPETFRFIVLIFNAAASGCLLTVGLVARKIPSQEKLNVQLNKQISKMGKDVNAFEGHGDTADNLANMTLGWVDQNRKTRDRMKLLNKMLQQSQEEYYSFRFKYKLLMQLASGEQARFRVEESTLKKEMENATMKEYNLKYAAILPDGLMNEDELMTVAAIIKDQTEEGGGLDSIVDNIIEEFLRTPTPEQQGKYHEAVPYLIKLAALKRERGESMPQMLDRSSTEKLLPDQKKSKKYSMKTVVDMVINRAQLTVEELPEGYPSYRSIYDESIKPWAEQFEKEKGEKAAEAADKFGTKTAKAAIK